MNKKSKKNLIDKIGLISLKDKKLLLTRSIGKDAWFQPGGKRENGESDREALVREIKEELDVAIIPETIAYFETFEAQAYGKPIGTRVRIICYTAQFTGTVTPQSEIADAQYFGYNEVPKTSLTGQMILEYLRQKKLIV